MPNLGVVFDGPKTALLLSLVISLVTYSTGGLIKNRLLN
jgi:hypothetical protein